MKHKNTYVEKIIDIVAEILEDESSFEIRPSSPLVGESAIVSSRQLVEILLEVEEFAEEKLGVEFDWASDSALSGKNSILRTPETITEHLMTLTK